MKEMYISVIQDAIEALEDLLTDPYNEKVIRQAKTIVEELKTTYIVIKENL